MLNIKKKTTYYPLCDLCGTPMSIDDGWGIQKCPECSNCLRIDEEGKWEWQRNSLSIDLVGRDKICRYCKKKMSGSKYTITRVTNSDINGYYECSNCKRVNYIFNSYYTEVK